VQNEVKNKPILQKLKLSATHLRSQNITTFHKAILFPSSKQPAITAYHEAEEFISHHHMHIISVRSDLTLCYQLRQWRVDENFPSSFPTKYLDSYTNYLIRATWLASLIVIRVYELYNI
jgi:hypothetical protein